jgi:hypothetical protein
MCAEREINSERHGAKRERERERARRVYNRVCMLTDR